MDGSIAYRRFLDGDNGALCEIICAYRQGMTAYIMGIVHDENASQEICEDVFVKLCLKRPKDNGKAGFKTWLYTIARNIALDYLRRQKREKSISLDCCFEIGDTENETEKQYFSDEKRKVLAQCIDSLKPEHRQIIFLRYFESFEVEEIAKILKKSSHNTSALLYRAKSALKAELERKGVTEIEDR